MIIADLSKYSGAQLVVVDAIKKTLNNELVENKLYIDILLNRYSKKDIEKAIDIGIRLSGYKVFVQTSDKCGEILRALEYGTNNCRALHLITKAVRKVIGGRAYEFIK